MTLVDEIHRFGDRLRGRRLTEAEVRALVDVWTDVIWPSGQDALCEALHRAQRAEELLRQVQAATLAAMGRRNDDDDEGQD